MKEAAEALNSGKMLRNEWLETTDGEGSIAKASARWVSAEHRRKEHEEQAEKLVLRSPRMTV